MTTDHEFSEMHRRWELPPDEPYLDEDDEQEREEAEARAEHIAEEKAMEAHFARKYGDPT